MKNMLKLGLALAAFASVACVLLALVNNFTAPVIAAAAQNEVNAGLAVVFPETKTFEKAENFVPDLTSPIKVESLYLAKKDGNVIGAVVQATGPTYDKATILLGLDMNRKITGIRFLSLSDTPGFGQKANEPDFYNQFTGKNADDKFVAGEDVDKISGATITTKGVAQIVKYAAYVAGKYLADNYGAASGSGEAPVVQQPATVFTYEEAYISLFPPEQYPDAQFTEISDGLNKIVRTAVIEKQVLVTVDGKTVGAMAAVRGRTFKKGGVVLTAVDTNEKIIGVRIIELKDTPKIGQLALEEDFYKQFDGKAVSQNLLINTDFDAISGATITSGCVADMVKIGAVEADKLIEFATGKTAVSSDYPLNYYKETN